MGLMKASAENIAQAADALAQGHLVALPTETVYGLGADGLNPGAVSRIFQAKGRPEDHPLILHVADLAHAKALAAEFPPAAQLLAQAFWPGPLTLILRRAKGVPDAVTGGQDTVGVRIPNHPVALALLKAFSKVGSGVIAAPSANRFGGVSPTRARDVAASLGDRLQSHDMILDGGDCQVGVESTIVDVSAVERVGVRILRPGGIGRQEILKVIGAAVSAGSSSPSAAATPTPRVSGSLASHYAPLTPLRLLARQDLIKAVKSAQQANPDVRLACVVFSALRDKTQSTVMANALAMVTEIRVAMDPVVYARDLYAHLNDLDAQGFDAILIECPPQTAEWEAVNDRLMRAAH
jgi:L-threonylcarbamoyladenylate synthase